MHALKTKDYKDGCIDMITVFIIAHVTVFRRGPDSVWILCTDPCHPYLSDITDIKVDDKGDFHMRVRYFNSRTKNITNMNLQIPAENPWFIHGRPRTVEREMHPESA